MAERAERLEARIKPDQKEFIKEAADLRGVSMSDFVVASAYDAAVRVVEENRVIRLSRRDQEFFVAALLNDDGEPNPRLKAAAERHGYARRPVPAQNDVQRLDRMLVELLGPGHDRDRFDCGVPPLNEFLQQRAKQEMKRDASTTYVLVDEEGDRSRIIGYYSLTAGSVPLQDFPPDVQQKLPRYPDVNATLLARLARDLAFRRMGIGERLLVDALAKAANASKTVASAAVFVDAKDAGAAAFYAQYGFIPLPEDPLRLFMTMKKVRNTFSL